MEVIDQMVHGAHKLEHTRKSDGLNEAASLPRTGKDTIFTSARMFGGKTCSIVQPGGDNDDAGISIQRTWSFNMKAEPPREKSLRKAKTISTQFWINIAELVNNSAGNFDERSFTPSRGKNKGYAGCSFSQPAVDVIIEDIPDVPKLQSPNCRDQEMGQSWPANAENSDYCKCRKISIEPTLPISLKFENIKYKVTLKGIVKSSDEKKYILHGITGSVHPGEVLALMGPSGSGKTTLLNLLSGRHKFNGGTITYNDQPYTKSLKPRIGFVTQDDVVFPHLTVKETLTYAALLRLPSTLNVQQKKERAVSVISELGLERCQNMMVGGTFVRGISGGERKRVCIGNEILLNPSLLLLDEPTSGLDSTTALRIVQMLHNITRSGKTVVTTIHQPSSRLFSKFDKLILLGKGSSLYFGKASEAMLYFSSIGCSPLIAMNPAEFLVDLANGNINDKSVPSELKGKLSPGSETLEVKHGGPSPLNVHEYFVEAYTSNLGKSERSKLLKPVMIEGEPDMQGRLRSRDLGATWWEQFSILFRRGLQERRHEYLSCMRITQVISTAIIIGLLWWHSDASSPRRLQDQAGLLFFISVFWAFFPLFTAIFTFPQERVMLAKERSVDMYKLSAYFLAKNTSDLPLDLILPIVFLVIVYLMVGLKPSFEAFSLTTLTVFLSIVAAQGLGLTIGAAFMDVKKATTLASVIIMAFMLSGEFFIQKVPPFISWVRYISFNYHTYRLLLKIQYSCSDSGPESGSCESPFIKGLQLDQGGKEVGAMMAMIIGYRLLAYLFLRTMKLRNMA